ncbi:MAG: cystathionine beta-lyase, partial [Bacteroidales bacterium]|nr:cystathionine beta-lyase [Bacteroidales bacterium]
MEYNFDKLIERASTASVKYDLRQFIFKNPDVLPMWVADMDFETPDFIRQAVIKRAQHPIYGYTFRPESYYQAIMNWFL